MDSLIFFTSDGLQDFISQPQPGSFFQKKD